MEMGATPKGGLRSGARPGGKDLPGKNHEAASPLKSRRALYLVWYRAGQPFEPPMKGFSPGRGDRTSASRSTQRLSPGSAEPPVARTARPIPRNPVEASWKMAHPADAFCPEAPCPRATTQASRKCQPRTRYGAPGIAGGLPKGN
jgi:hypothetical protein